MVSCYWHTHRIGNANHRTWITRSRMSAFSSGQNPGNASGIPIGDEIDKLDKVLRYEQRLTRQ